MSKKISNLLSCLTLAALFMSACQPAPATLVPPTAGLLPSATLRPSDIAVSPDTPMPPSPSVAQNAQEFPVLKGEYFGQTPPGIVPEEFAPGIVTGFIHGTVAISPKGDEIYWVENTSTEHIVYSKLENGTWTKPVVADFVKDYLTMSNGGLTFSPDGEKLFFFSDRQGGLGSYDAWYVERTDNGWSKPINAGEPYNSVDDELTPLFTNNGKAYCVRSTKNHEYVLLSFKYSNGMFSDLTPMDVFPEYGPWWTLFVSLEEEYLVFAGGADDADLYIRFKNKEGSWGTPVNMGDKINTKAWERFPVVSPDGKYLFFTRGDGHAANVFWVSTTIIDDLR